VRAGDALHGLVDQRRHRILNGRLQGAAGALDGNRFRYDVGVGSGVELVTLTTTESIRVVVSCNDTLAGKGKQTAVEVG